MLYRMETNLTVGGGSRGYGLGSTLDGFSLLTGLLRARENEERPRESRWISPRQIMHQQVGAIRGT